MCCVVSPISKMQWSTNDWSSVLIVINWCFILLMNEKLLTVRCCWQVICISRTWHWVTCRTTDCTSATSTIHTWTTLVVAATRDFISLQVHMLSDASLLMCRSAWIGCFVCLSLCLSVFSHHNSKTNDPKLFKLDTLGYPRSDMVFGVKWSRSQQDR